MLRYDLFGEMLADRFALAIRVGREINCRSLFCSLLQVSNDLSVITLLGIGNDLVIRREIILDIHPEPLRRQIFDMPDRGLHDEVVAEIFIDRLRLGGRFYYD